MEKDKTGEKRIGNEERTGIRVEVWNTCKIT